VLSRWSSSGRHILLDGFASEGEAQLWGL